MTINLTPYEKNDIIRYLTSYKQVKTNEMDNLYYKEKYTKKEREQYYRIKNEIKDIDRLIKVLNNTKQENDLFRRTKDTIDIYMG